MGLSVLAYTYVYAIRKAPDSERGTMQRKAKVFGSDVVLSPRPFDWSSYIAEGPVASATFMEGVEDLPVQEREP